MQHAQIDFNFKDILPPSANAMYQANRGTVHKSKTYKAFQKEVAFFLHAKKHKMRQFETSFSRYDHALACRIVIELPEDQFFTKRRQLPKKMHDLDNFIKTFIDTVFKNFQEIDDSYITELVALKKPSTDGRFYARLRLEITDLD